jgi:hypothetical protein
VPVDDDTFANRVAEPDPPLIEDELKLIPGAPDEGITLALKFTAELNVPAPVMESG